MKNLSAYSGWIGHRNIGDEAIFMTVKELLPELTFSDIDYVEQQDVIVYGGGTIFPSIISRNPDYRDDAFTAAIGVGVRSPMFWNRRFSPLDFGYYTGNMLNKNGLEINIVDDTLFTLTKFFDSFWTYNKTLTKRDFEAIKSADVDFFGVRGPLSSDLLSQYDIEHEVIGDTALALEPSSYHTEDRPMIAVTLRDNTYGWATNDYHEIIVEFCQRNADEYEFVFLPFWPPDIEVCRNATRRVPNARFEDYCSCIDVQGILDEISRCNILIGDKLHSNVLSACSYTPFISLEYRPKNQDFAESVGMGEFNIRTDEVNVDWLESRLAQIENNEELVVELEREVEGYRESLRSFSRRVANSVETP
jgi:polysaccharide pyruvyl transferase WcaK-like protein